MNKQYYTVGSNASCEIIINKSRFIGQAFYVAVEEEAVDTIRKVREKYPDATHHCYAYTVGREGTVVRFNDDGEPGGTAGMPILQVIQQRELHDVLVVVTRYFGGIKLGAGGLVRAYSKSAALALDKSGTTTMILSNKGLLTFDYSLLGTLEHFLRKNHVIILDTEYQDKVIMKIITDASWDNFCNSVTDFCNGRVECEYVEEVYYNNERYY